MNVELQIQEGMYDDLSDLLSRAKSLNQASAYVAQYFQIKMGSGVVDTYDYAIKDMGPDGFQAIVEFCFTWNLNNQCNMHVFPKDNPIKAYDRAMTIV